MIVPDFPITDPARPRPYLWPTWITRLLSGEDRCWWRAWYRAHYRYTKTPEEPGREGKLDEYNRRHDAMVEARATELRSQGWEVRVEEEGAFKLAGTAGDLAGKPDIIGVRGSEGVVEDCKGGKRRDSDHWQVLVYLFALSLSWMRSLAVKGYVVYQEGPPVRVRPLGPVEKEKITLAVQKVMGDQVPEAAPSPRECQYCDVLACPVRFTPEPPADARSYF